MISFVCVLFQRPDERFHEYSPLWVDKLFRGIRRNCTKSFELVCFTDRPYLFDSPVRQVPLLDPSEGWMSLLEVFRPGLGIRKGCLFGLDTILVNDITPIVSYDTPLGLTRSPYNKNDVCNGIMLFNRETADDLWQIWNASRQHWRRSCSVGLGPKQGGRPSELQFLKRAAKHYTLLDDLFPNQIVSYKMGYKPDRLRDYRIVYFHGDPKPPYISHELLEHWV